VANTGVTRNEGVCLKQVNQSLELSSLLGCLQGAAIGQDCNTCRVIPAVLLTLQTAQKNGKSVLLTDVTHDSTHKGSSLVHERHNACVGQNRQVSSMQTGAISVHTTPFVEISRDEWAELAPTTASPLTEADIESLRGLGDRLNLQEVEDVYLPLSRLLSIYASGARKLHRDTSNFLGERATTTPFVIGVAGSVAVGKSTVARLLQMLMARWEDTPRVELVTTDGFLYPNAELERRGILDRKGFPESYDRRALLRFVSKIKSGAAEATAPVYSHLSYDILPDEKVVVRQPDVLIVEGLNVLQPPTSGGGLAVSDLFDFTVYVDARTQDIATWYQDRFLTLQRGAFSDPDSYFHRYASLTEEEARETAQGFWERINLPNLEENIRPTRSRATLVLRKAANHAVSTVLLRKI
jgi:type I pantothenate kinase